MQPLTAARCGAHRAACVRGITNETPKFVTEEEGGSFDWPLLGKAPWTFSISWSGQWGINYTAVKRRESTVFFVQRACLRFKCSPQTKGKKCTIRFSWAYVRLSTGHCSEYSENYNRLIFSLEVVKVCMWICRNSDRVILFVAKQNSWNRGVYG